MRLAIEIINKEIAQRVLANKLNHLRWVETTLELESLNKAISILLEENYLKNI